MKSMHFDLMTTRILAYQNFYLHSVYSLSKIAENSIIHKGIETGSNEIER